MIRAWVVTSRAVVGSSAIRTSGFVGDRHRDHHPLPHAAGELVRVVVERVAPAAAARHPGAGLDRAVARLPLADVLVRRDRLGDLAPDRLDGVERGHRILVDHRDPAASHPRHLLLGQSRADRAPPSSTWPPAMCARGGSSRISASAVSDLPLPDSPTMPTRRPDRDLERDAAHRPDRRPARDRDLDDEVAHGEGGVRHYGAGGGAHDREGSRTRCTLSPSDIQRQHRDEDHDARGRSGTSTSGRGSRSRAGAASPRTCPAAGHRGRRS